MEDLPYEDNQVMLPDKNGQHGSCRLVLRYQIRDHDRERIKAFRDRLQSILRPYRYTLINFTVSLKSVV
jgi:hypothetical protein